MIIDLRPIRQTIIDRLTRGEYIVCGKTQEYARIHGEFFSLNFSGWSSHSKLLKLTRLIRGRDEYPICDHNLTDIDKIERKL